MILYKNIIDVSPRVELVSSFQRQRKNFGERSVYKTVIFRKDPHPSQSVDGGKVLWVPGNTGAGTIRSSGVWREVDLPFK